MSSQALVDAARDYVERGLSVIALTGKVPNGVVHPHGLHDAFTGPDAVFGDAFTHPRTTGVGILTGPVYYVVDIDGEEGAAAWKALVGADQFIPTRWVAKTGRGLHLWYAHYDSWPTTKLAEKLDFKGVGGYVAAPPSVHPSGSAYEWLCPPDEVPWAMPDELEQRLTRGRAERSAWAATKRTMRQTSPSSFVDGKLYAVATFDGIIGKVKDEREGNRNAMLYWAARTMIEEGADAEDLDELLTAAQGAGLARYEARRTIQSAVAGTRG